MINKITSSMFAKILRGSQFYKNISIKKKLLLVVNLQILIPLIFVGFFAYKSSEEIINSKSLSYSNDVLSSIGLRLQDTVTNLTNISGDISMDKNIYDALISYDTGNNNNNLTEMSIHEIDSQLTNLFITVKGNRPEINSICIVTDSGLVLPRRYPSTDSELRSVVNREYSKMSEKADEVTRKAAWFFETSSGVVKNAYLVKKVYNRDDYTEIGMLVVQIKMDSLKDVLKGLESEVMQNTTILTPKGDIIVSKNKQALERYKSVIKDTPYDKDSFIDQENDIFVAYTYLKDNINWRIVTFIPLNELYSDVDKLRNRIIVLCLASIIILSIVSIYMSFDMIKPINRLVKAMKNMNINNISDSYIEVDRSDELGFLHKTFNNMAKEIDHLVTWIYREQITRKEAELKALQSQINPHFLFNTLESINWMAQLNNVPEISDIVSDLSALLEASIGRDDRLIPIEEEFMYIDKYISLLKRRFEDKITLKKEIDPQVLYIKIPRLLIQPLIENAVYHGVENSRGKGVIMLNARIQGDLLILEVIDNGNGISKDDLIKLNKSLEMDNDTYFKSLREKKNKSIGIDNVNRRIKLFYGEKYGIKIESSVNIFTKVTVSLPLQTFNTKESYYVQGSNN
ncbi:sensor histidine kinase [Ruminiclostridium josui]|uniref:sensor histidine kinase n=2 Tax=Ruminiclostridium josui TaxID=1499 RepID=UPI000463A499|nr:sensor histidine kinase [Ruminiclostridium josui]